MSILNPRKGRSTLVYDAHGKLIKKSSATVSARFNYDKAGNNLNNQSKYHKETNQLLENSTHTFSYDARGNLRTKYTFNALNQVTGISITQNQKTIKSFLYTYDAIGRRISKHFYNAQNNHKTTRHYYVYDNQNIIAILDKDKHHLATITHHDTKIDTPLSITTIHGTYYYHRDHQGSIIALSNEHGEIIETITYDEHYGSILEHKRRNNNETLNPYGYTGREIEMNDLYYYRARYYDSSTQRFLSLDPIGFSSGDFNFYRYVGNSPIGFRDPLGLWEYTPSAPEEIEVREAQLNYIIDLIVAPECQVSDRVKNVYNKYRAKTPQNNENSQGQVFYVDNPKLGLYSSRPNASYSGAHRTNNATHITGHKGRRIEITSLTFNENLANPADHSQRCGYATDCNIEAILHEAYHNRYVEGLGTPSKKEKAAWESETGLPWPEGQHSEAFEEAVDQELANFKESYPDLTNEWPPLQEQELDASNIENYSPSSDINVTFNEEFISTLPVPESINVNGDISSSSIGSEDVALPNDDIDYNIENPYDEWFMDSDGSDTLPMFNRSKN